jgi:ssDNA-binding Zn-finger/Zn-ribbon topoisomerase 1
MEQEENLRREEVKKRFDDTLANHMASNVGHDQGTTVGPFNLAMVSCLVLLAEREGQLEMFPSDAPERYTRETFLGELEEIGLDLDVSFPGQIDSMVEKDLILVGPDGTFSARPVAMALTKKIDEAFPGMPGMNLVAYLVQTIEEVLSGRKELDFAVRQFDQTLTIYGNGSSRPAVSGIASADPVPAQKAPSKDALKSALSATLRKRQAGQVKEKQSSRLSGRPRIVTASGEVKSLEIRDLFPRASESAPAAELPRAPEPEEVETPSSDALPQEDAPAHADEAGKAIEDLPQAIPDEEAEREALQVGVQDALFLPGEASVEESDRDLDPHREGAGSSVPAKTGWPDQDSLSLETVQADGTEREPEQAGPATVRVAHETKAQEEATPDSDEALAEKIEAFESELAMSCPVCGTGRIQPKETAKGKTFYVCSLPGCIFVSWGKPYHLECPRCKNPFLVEFAGKGGETILKCPRATCRYQQPIPGEAGDVLAQPLAPGLEKQRRLVAAACPSGTPKKRKVVRRRVVRKKR